MVPFSIDPPAHVPHMRRPLTLIEPTAAVAAQPIQLVICW